MVMDLGAVMVNVGMEVEVESELVVVEVVRNIRCEFLEW